jgi:hypothetical protein
LPDRAAVERGVADENSEHELALPDPIQCWLD